MKNYILAIILIAVLCAGCATENKSTVQPEHSDLIKQEVKDAIDLRIDKGVNQSIVVGVVDSSGVDFYSNGLTHANGSKPNEFTSYEIGSITKVFTGLLLAQHVVSQQVNLVDSIRQFLPNTLELNDTIGSLRLNQLATHSAGLARQASNLRADGYTPTDPYAHYNEKLLFEELRNHRLQFVPGQKSRYSNLGMSLLGYLLSNNEGKNYFSSLSSNILEPLQMQETKEALESNNKALGFTFNVPVENWNFDVLAGAGVLKSNVNDMLLFLSAQLGLSKTPLHRAIEISQLDHFVIDEDRAIGLGWGIYTLKNGDQLYRHNGGTAGYRSFVGYLKKAKKVVIVLTNSSNEGVDDIGLHQLVDSLKIKTDYKQSIAYKVSSVLEQNETIAPAEVRSSFELANLNSEWGELNALGYTYLKKNENDKSIIVFQLNNEIHPNSADGYDSLGEAFYANGQLEESIINYQKALSLDSDYKNAKRMIQKIRTEQKKMPNTGN